MLQSQQKKTAHHFNIIVLHTRQLIHHAREHIVITDRGSNGGFTHRVPLRERRPYACVQHIIPECVYENTKLRKQELAAGAIFSMARQIFLAQIRSK
jgi:hypothetical protein